MVILTGVIIISINNTNILDKANDAVGMQNLATEKERLEMVRGEVLMATGGKITVDQYIEKLVEKGITEASKVTTSEDGKKTIITDMGHAVIVEAEGKDSIKITVVGKEGELPPNTQITYNITWENGKATLIVTKPVGVSDDTKIEYSLDNGVSYTEITGSITEISSGTTILVRLNGGNELGEAKKITVKDNVKPQVDAVVGTRTENTIAVSVIATENETGIKECRYYIKKTIATSYELVTTQLVPTSYTYEGLVANETYDIKVEVEDNAGNVEEKIITQTSTTGEKPSINTVSVSEQKTNSLKVTVELNKGKNVTYSYYYRVKDSGTNYTLHNSTETTATTYTITGLEASKSYDIQVIATNAEGTDTKTTEGSTLDVPTAETNISHKNTTWADGKATITVEKASSVDSTLSMEYSTNGGTSYIPTTGSITGITNGTTVLVRLTDGKNAGIPKEIIVTDITKPSVEVAIGTTTETTIPVNVTATDNETGIKEYRYYIKKTSATTYDLKATTQTAIYTYEGLDAETSYDIKVEVEDKSENTGNGTAKATTAKAKPVISTVTVTDETTKSLKVTVALSKGTDVTYTYNYRIKNSGADYTTFSENVASASETITDLLPSLIYEIQVIATNTAGTDTKVAEGTTKTIPSAETSVIHTSTVWKDGKATITVEKVDGVDSALDIEYSLDDGTSYKLTTGSITGITDGTTVLVRLTDGKNASISKEITVEDKTLPQVTVEAGTTTETTIPVTVTVVENETGIKEYRYYIKKKTATTYELKATTQTVTYTYEGLDAEIEYDIKVEVEDKSENTGSGTIAATTTKAKPVISQVSISESKTNSLKVTVWLSKGKEVKYKYSYRVKGTTNYTTFSENVASNTEIITGLQDDTIYEIQVVATNTVGTSTKTAEATTTLVPTAESNITHTNTVWTDGKATIAVTKASTVDSTLTMEYSTNGGTSYTSTTGSIAGIADGTKVLVRLTDGKNAGEPIEITVEDITKPSVEVAIGTPTETTIPVTVTATDNETGIKEYRYYIKKTSVTTYDLKATTQTAIYTYEGLDAETSYDIKVEVEDKSGNTEPVIKEKISTLKAKPVISTVTVTEATTKSLKVTVALSKGTDVTYTYNYRIKNSGANYTTFSENVASASETITDLLPSLIYEIQVIATNTAGTDTKVAEGTTKTIPSAETSVIHTSTVWKDGKATITVEKVDGVDSALDIEYSLDDGTSYKSTTGSITGITDGTTVLVRLTDGKNASTSKEITVEDKTLPQVTVEAGTTTETTIPVTVTAVENETGIKEYRYYIKKKTATTYELKATTQTATYTYEGLDAEIEYDIKVEVEDKSENTGSGTIAATTAKAKPVISTVTVIETKTNSLKIAVALSKGTDVTYSYYYRIKDSGKEYTLHNETATTSTTYTITGLTQETTYEIKVVATNTTGTDSKTVVGTTKKVGGSSSSSVTSTVDGVPIPKGFVASQATGENTKDGGLVIYEGTTPVTDDNVFDAKRNRNQYVWVPVDDFTKFIRQNFGKSYTISSTIGTEYWELEVDENNMPKRKTLLSDYIADNDLDYITEATIAEAQAMYASVKEYKGFYIARYEAGLDVGSHKTSDDGVITTAVHSKMNKAPYNYVRWTYNDAMNQDTNGAVEVARSIYPETNANYGVVSTLTYSVQWDRTLAWWIETKAKNGTGDVTIQSNTQIKNSTNYGNHKNNEIPLDTFNNGAKYLLYSNLSLATTYADVTAKKTTSDSWLLTTGATEETRVNNIYDMAGNLGEWTMEGRSVSSLGSSYRISRGSMFESSGDGVPILYRSFTAPNKAARNVGFRSSLYIKVEKDIRLDSMEWVAGKANVTVSKAAGVDSYLTMEYSTNGGTSYTATTGSIAGIADKTTVLVRLTDGKNTGEPIEITVEDKTIPRVTVVAGVATVDTIPVTVTAVENETGIKEYRYYIKKTSDTTYGLKATTSTSTYTYTGLEADTSYDIKVEVEDKSDNTGTVTANTTTAKTKPVISSVGVVETTTDSIKLQVTLSKGTDVTYNYYYRVQDSGTDYTLYNETPTTETMYTLSGLTAATTYELKIVAINTAGEAEYYATGRTTEETSANWVVDTVDEVPIPKGFVASGATGENAKNGGLVIYEGTDAVTDDNVFDAKRNRNQYVWVPVDDFSKFVIQYSAISDTLGSSYWELELDENNMPKGKTLLSDYIADNDLDYITETTIAEAQAMYASVKEYKGFYIARYEAGLDVGSQKTGDDGVIIKSVHSKMNKAPYNWVRWTYNDAMNEDTNGAVEVARSIYPESNVNYGVVSTLTYGVQWDRTLAWWIEAKAQNGTGDVTIQSIAELKKSKNYGNYNDNEIPNSTFNSGASVSEDSGKTYITIDSSYSKPEYQSHLLTTGATEKTRVNNIYDMAGNVSELTMEGYESNIRCHYGGSYADYSGDCFLIWANSHAPGWGDSHIGFRPSLYIKPAQSDTILQGNITLESIEWVAGKANITVVKAEGVDSTLTMEYSLDNGATYTSTTGTITGVPNGTIVLVRLTDGTNYSDTISIEVVEQAETVPAEWAENVTAIVDSVPIPKGFVASQATGENTKNGGLVIYEGTEPVTAANVFDAKRNRNQYVWVPVDDFTKFIRQNFGKYYTISDTLGSTCWDLEDEYWELELDENNMPKGKTLLSDYISDNDLDYITEATIAEAQAMYASVKEYKGFYIARYEAGLEVGSHKTSNDGVIITAVHSKMNKAPYNYVRWTYNDAMNQDTNGAVEVARSIYPETNANYGVVSILTYGVQWDRTLDWWIETKAKNGTGDVTIESNTQINNSTNYGNYYNNEIPLNTFNNGAKYLLYSSSLATTYADVTAKKTTSDIWLLTTGATEETRVNNIYDMAGNLWENTMEGVSSYGRVQRGGDFREYGVSIPVSDRYNGTPYGASNVVGFRSSLYIKK